MGLRCAGARLENPKTLMISRYQVPSGLPLALTCLLLFAAALDVRAQTPPISPTDKALLQAEVLKFGDVEPSAEALERMAATLEESRRQKLRLTESQKKVSPLLRTLAARAGQGGPGRAGSALRTPGLPAPMLPGLQVDERGNVQVEIQVRDVSDAGALRGRGIAVEAVDAERGVVVASVSPGQLMDVAELAFVEQIMPIIGEITRVGSVTSEGVEALDVDEVRDVFGLDGTGVKACIISNGINGLAEAQATGDLPGAIDVCPLNENIGAEGTAMLEIVHDLAPGAELGFCPAFGDLGQQGLANAIAYLAGDAFGGEGCDVIVDDVAYLTEPYFQDGIVAQAVDAAEAAGVAYFSSAGNSAGDHYERPYVDASPGGIGDAPIPFFDLHDFGRAAGLSSDTTWNGVVAGAGSSVVLFLQWNDPFGASSNDYDLYLFDRLGFPVGDSTGRGLFPCFNDPDQPCFGINGTAPQDGDDNPLEVAAIVNPYGGDDPFAQIEPFFIVIDRFFGDPDKLFEINFNSNNGLFAVSSTYNVPEGSVWGHSAAEGAIAVGAIDVNDEGLDDIESFSSRGPSLIFFAPDGTPNFEARPKPDIVAVDGVSVTGFGGFPTTFFGTSASAPHAAAVGALLLDLDPALSPNDVETILEETAEDLGEPGFDFVYGNGLISAFDAVVGAIGDSEAPECQIVSVEDGVLTVEVQDLGVGLDRIEQRRATNATLDIPDFPRGTTEPVQFTATKINPDKRSTVIVTVYDVGENEITCDPVVTRLAAGVPEVFELGQNYPNPFNPTTKITFKLPETATVNLTVYDVAGREVATLVREPMEAGTFEVEWNGRDNAGRMLPSGMYLYRMNAGTFSDSQTMVLLK